jgi:hypothetical protein
MKSSTTLTFIGVEIAIFALASLLHRGIVRIGDLKADLAAAGVPVRSMAQPPSPEEVAAWLG